MNRAETMSKVELRGREAYRNKSGLGSNPYHHHTGDVRKWHWEQGWLDQQWDEMFFNRDRKIFEVETK